MGPGLFFTGTDTGVGKTFVAAAVARLIRQTGRPVRVSKPVATGATRVDGRWVCEDSVRLAEAADETEGLESVTPWVFAEPVAPPVAARGQGIRLTLTALVDAVRDRRRKGTVLIVEGVGGLLCPLTECETVADLVAALNLPLVVVVRRSLGTLNHTLLTLEAARTRRLKVAGVVVNETAPVQSLAEETNVEELKRRIDVPLLAVVPFQPEVMSWHAEALAKVDWWRLSHSNEEHPGS